MNRLAIENQISFFLVSPGVVYGIEFVFRAGAGSWAFGQMNLSDIDLHVVFI